VAPPFGDLGQRSADRAQAFDGGGRIGHPPIMPPVLTGLQNSVDTSPTHDAPNR
jgi:hypothetical protein